MFIKLSQDFDKIISILNKSSRDFKQIIPRYSADQFEGSHGSGTLKSVLQ